MTIHNPHAVRMYQHLFERGLFDGEVVLNAAPSIHVEISERYGRGTGDGTLAVTSARIIHVYSKAIFKTPGFGFFRDHIQTVDKNWIIIPKTSNLKISGFTDGESWVHNFYLGNRFLDEVLEGLKS